MNKTAAEVERKAIMPLSKHWKMTQIDDDHIRIEADGLAGATVSVLSFDPIEMLLACMAEEILRANSAKDVNTWQAFAEWADGKGHDMAHAYDTERSRWLWLSPMTADLWESWQAAIYWKAVVGQPPQDERCPVCGEDEPFTGTCGAGDNPRALCKRPPAEPAQPVAAEAMKLSVIRHWPEGFEDRLQHVWLDVASFIPNVKLYDLQRVLAEFGFRMEIYDAAMTGTGSDESAKEAK